MAGSNAFIMSLAAGFSALVWPALAAAQSTLMTLTFGGQYRTYVLYVPARYQAGHAYPLMLVEHGDHGTGQQMEATTGFDALADAEGFFVAYPNSRGPDWIFQGANNDVEFNAAVVGAIEGQFSIDPSRIYVSGFSDGGRMATVYACHQPAGNAVAGLAVVANDENTKLEASCNGQPPIPTVLFHGTADPISPYDGNRSEVSAPATAAYWAGFDGCSSRMWQATRPDELSNGQTTTDSDQAWVRCSNGVSVSFYTINGGGHSWPGSVSKVQNPVPATGPVSMGLDASKIIWHTLSRYAAGTPQSALVGERQSPGN
jgi:polyhydroxybutyrate depolymerase